MITSEPQARILSRLRDWLLLPVMFFFAFLFYVENARATAQWCLSCSFGSSKMIICPHGSEWDITYDGHETGYVFYRSVGTDIGNWGDEFSFRCGGIDYRYTVISASGELLDENGKSIGICRPFIKRK